MKIKDILATEYSSKDIRITKHFWVWIQGNYWDIEEDKQEHPYLIELHSDLNPIDDTLFFDLSSIKLTGEETISQVRKIVKNYMKSNTISNTKVIKSCYDELNYNDYNMTRKGTKQFVNAMKKKLCLGNDIIFNDFGVYALTTCAMALGY